METSGAKGHSKMDFTGFCSHKNIKEENISCLSTILSYQNRGAPISR